APPATPRREDRGGRWPRGASFDLADGHEAEGGRWKVLGRDVLDVLCRDAADALLVPIGVVEPEPLVLDGGEEIGDLRRRVEPEREAPDQELLGERQLAV